MQPFSRLPALGRREPRQICTIPGLQAGRGLRGLRSFDEESEHLPLRTSQQLCVSVSLHQPPFSEEVGEAPSDTSRPSHPSSPDERVVGPVFKLRLSDSSGHVHCRRRLFPTLVLMQGTHGGCTTHQNITGCTKRPHRSPQHAGTTAVVTLARSLRALRWFVGSWIWSHELFKNAIVNCCLQPHLWASATPHLLPTAHPGVPVTHILRYCACPPRLLFPLSCLGWRSQMTVSREGGRGQHIGEYEVIIGPGVGQMLSKRYFRSF